MHNGELPNLAAVIEFYDQGGIPNPGLSGLIRPLNLTTKEKQMLEQFLKSLTGAEVPTLVSDAFNAPVGDTD